jgi:hypothetical protein
METVAVDQFQVQTIADLLLDYPELVDSDWVPRKEPPAANKHLPSDRTSWIAAAAAGKGNRDILECLLVFGANVNVVTSAGTALSASATHGLPSG